MLVVDYIKMEGVILTIHNKEAETLNKEVNHGTVPKSRCDSVEPDW